ncbi:MAG TPA: hypothetical protein DCM05_16420, partial [Elusimicrobia bacterium]|nr:hypothetical protein [Elusimicrobiota bacterium]
MLIARSDPQRYLYPLIQTWPTASRTAETLLVRREGEGVLFLNELRHRQEPALSLRIPLSRQDSPAAQAVLGRVGGFEGLDYRGVRVLSDVRPVPGTDWFLVSKVDAGEILAEVRYRGGAILLFTIMGILMAGGMAVLLQHVRQRRLFQDLAYTRRERDESRDEIRATLYGIHDGVIATDREGRVTRMNSGAERLTGWTEAESLGRPLTQVFAIIDEKARMPMENPVERVLREGVFVGLASHTLLIARDKTERPIADSIAPIRGKDGGVTGVVLVFRDQSDDRAKRKSLQASESRYRRLFESAKDGILILDAETGRIDDVNPFLADLVGHSREHLIGREVWEIGAWKDLFANKEKFLELQRKGYVRYEDLPLQAADGRKIDVEFVSNVYQVDQHDVIQCNVRDITNRKRAEEVLRVTQRQQKAILDSIPDIAWLKDKDGRFIAVNEAFGKSCGLAPDALPGKTDLDIWPKEMAERYRADDQEVMRTGMRKRVDEPLADKEGKILLIETIKTPILDVDRRIIGTTGIARDITERNRAEAGIREAYEMRGVINAMLQRSLTNDTLQKKLADHLAGLLDIPWLSIEPKGAVFLLDEAGKALALTAQQGLAPALLISCANVPVGKCLCGKAAQLRQVVTSASVDSGHEITYEGILLHGHYCAPIMAGGRVLGVLNLYLKEGIVLTGKQEDFIKAATDILAANIIHSQVEGQLGQSQKMEAVGRLAGGVAHDFNNLLTAINGYAGFVLEGLPKDDPKREDVQEIMAAGDRAAGLTRQLLAFSRKQVLAPQVLDVNAVVGATVKMLTRLIGEDIKLETKLAVQPCMVKVDAGQIDQVLMNLAVNARDAMPKGGTLTLETGLLSADADFSSRHPDIPSGPLVCLSVRDTGCGMGDDVRERLFEPFFTTKEKGQGTGLGLAMVFGIIKQSGGEIEVESELERGTTFRIYLPQVDIASKDKDKDK